MAVSSYYSYYPSGDAFASGSDDATVSNPKFSTQTSIINMLKILSSNPLLCCSAACMTWGQTERWPFIPKRASYLESPVLISLLAVRNMYFCSHYCSLHPTKLQLITVINQSFRTATLWWLQWLHHKCLGCSQRNTGLYSVWTWEPCQYIARFTRWDGLQHRFLGPHSSGMRRPLFFVKGYLSGGIL